MDRISTEQLVLVIGEQHLQIRALLTQVDQLKKELARFQAVPEPQPKQPE